MQVCCVNPDGTASTNQGWSVSPRGARITPRCRGRACPRRAHGTVAVAGVKHLLKRLGGTRHRAGDRLLLVVSAPHRRPERIRLTIRRGRQPIARLLKR